jgi:hypothetical protein
MDETIRGERLQIMLTGEELAALDDWRFARRMPSRAAAVRELLKRGLAGGRGYRSRVGRRQVHRLRRRQEHLRLVERRLRLAR